MAGDHLGAAADDDLVDIAADLNLVMSAGDRHRVIVVAIADHRDRRRPRADLPAGIAGYRRQRHQGVEVAHQPLADSLGMTPQNLILPFEALLLQPDVQVIETVEARHRHQKVPPAITDCAFDITVRHCLSDQWRSNSSLVALARTAEPVLKEIVRLQLRESSGSLPFSVPEDPRHRDRGVVVEP